VKQQTREHIAAALLGAYSSRIPVEPLTGQYDDLTVEDADETQLLQVADWTAAGDTITATFAGLGRVTVRFLLRRADGQGNGRDRRPRQHRHRPAGQATAQ
jgi:hypothetical protein